jgi:DNA helicase HerA-like ATPase
MAETIGKVLDKAKTDSFQFVSKKPFKAKFVEVKIDHISSNARIIGEITEKESINPYFERPADIRYVKDNDEGVNVRSLYVSKVDILALINNGERTEVLFPPLPGSNVSEAKESNVKIALSLGESGIDIGYLKGYKNLPFKILHQQLLRTHISVLGQTGSGKSYLGAKLAIELLKLRRSAKVPSEIAIPIIFDSSGEYSVYNDISNQGQSALIMETINGKEHHFPLLNERYLSLLYDIYDVDEKQESELETWFNPISNPNPSSQMNERRQLELIKQPTAAQLINEFGRLRLNSTKQLANSLEEYLKKYNQLKNVEGISIPYKVTSKMRRLNLKIRKTVDLNIIDQLSSGLIINLSEYENYEERQIAMLFFLRQVYERARNKKLPSRIVLFIDEAHNYVPSVYKSYCKGEILKIAREGRKYGIALCLISQRPRWVDPTALSQCGNIFIFRIQNSDDKKHIFDSASLPDMVRNINIAKFKTSEMIATGDVVENAMHCIVSKIDENFISAERKRRKDNRLKKSKQPKNSKI